MFMKGGLIMNNDIKCKLVEKVSKKTNLPYYALIIDITNDYQKVVFLEKAEIELLKLHYQIKK